MWRRRFSFYNDTESLPPNLKTSEDVMKRHCFFWPNFMVEKENDAITRESLGEFESSHVNILVRLILSSFFLPRCFLAQILS